MRSNSASDSSVSSVKVALRDGGYLVTAQSAEYLDAALMVQPSSGRVGQNDAARVVGEQPGIGEGDETAEAAAEHDRLGEPERVTQPPQVIGPGPQVPGFGGAVIAAAVPALVVVDDLDVLAERFSATLTVMWSNPGPP